MPPFQTAIREFVGGKKANPWPDQPSVKIFKLRSERLEATVESIVLEINYDSGQWKVSRQSTRP